MFQALIPYGWSADFESAFLDAEAAANLQGCVPARILNEQRQLYQVITPAGERLAVVSGKLRYHAHQRADYPSVGDWVVLQAEGPNERAKILQVLPRHSKISRKTKGDELKEQIIGSNVDTLLIVSSFNQELNLRRLERYLVLAQNSGAQPVLVLNKADLADAEQRASQLAALSAIAQQVPIVSLSALSQQGFEGLQPYFGTGKTIAMIGSSGVGKSTLLNALSGVENQKTQAIRQQDARGRHTTVQRQLFLLPGEQGLLLDSPGLREIQLWEGGEGLEVAFGDILTLVSHCRFPDCRHSKEPDCAVREALESGLLDKKRWRNYLKLSNESLYLAQRKAEMRDIENRIRARNKYKQARRAALYGYLSQR